MLPRKNRITRKDFPDHKVQGFRVFSPIFSMVVYKGKEGQKENRVSVVVSKKTAKTAVLRNFLRRRFYEATSPLLRNAINPVTIVVYPKKEAEKAQFSVLKEEIVNTLLKAKLIK